MPIRFDYILGFILVRTTTWVFLLCQKVVRSFVRFQLPVATHDIPVKPPVPSEQQPTFTSAERVEDNGDVLRWNDVHLEQAVVAPKMNRSGSQQSFWQDAHHAAIRLCVKGQTMKGLVKVYPHRSAMVRVRSFRRRFRSQNRLSAYFC